MNHDDDDPADADNTAAFTHRRAGNPSRSTRQGPVRFPERIGRYRIRCVLGEGGMGTVFEAEQEQPRRTVALKVVRSEFMTPELLRRFAYESQVLGRLQHPGIAQIYEAGTVTDDRGHTVPFFAMELVRGQSLTSHAEQHRLGTRERLELVAQVCDAIEHAHQKGVIHRDLKPANILVDGTGAPKVLDFGVARATDRDVQQSTLQTDVGQIVGTLEYMSPEQLGGNPHELDTRSDVYALGVIAYELVARRHPYDKGRGSLPSASRTAWT
jgi:serine/threonine protein kinase